MPHFRIFDDLGSHLQSKDASLYGDELLTGRTTFNDADNLLEPGEMWGYEAELPGADVEPAGSSDTVFDNMVGYYEIVGNDTVL